MAIILKKVASSAKIILKLRNVAENASIYTTLYSKSKLPLKSHPSLGEHATKL